MRHKIKPNNDFVIKYLFGKAGHEYLLMNFINSMISPAPAIVEVMINDPHSIREAEQDKLSIADISATDSYGNVYQIEMQNTSPFYLGDRIAFHANRMFSAQLIKGQGYTELKSIYSIWLLSRNFYPDNAYHHASIIYDPVNNQPLTDKCNYHVFELAKWTKPDELLPADYWLYLFTDGGNWLELPECLKHSSIMRDVMDILRDISDRNELYARYAREDAERVKITEENIKRKLAEEVSSQQQEISTQKREISTQKREITSQKAQIDEQLREIEALKLKLQQAGID